MKALFPTVDLDGRISRTYTEVAKVCNKINFVLRQLTHLGVKHRDLVPYYFASSAERDSEKKEAKNSALPLLS